MKGPFFDNCSLAMTESIEAGAIDFRDFVRDAMIRKYNEPINTDLRRSNSASTLGKERPMTEVK